MQVIYIVDDKLGGIASLISNLINNKTTGTRYQQIILIDKVESTFSKTTFKFNVDSTVDFKCSYQENAYSVVKRLHSVLPIGPGALVLNDSLEMQMLDHYDTELTTYQIVHDEYNFQLALKYPHVVDVFIAHSKLYFDALIKNLSDRQNTIFYLPHGVTIPDKFRAHRVDKRPLRLAFLGRISSAKGVFDLPVITRLLREWNVPYSFTCIGNGPELEDLKTAWKDDDNVTFFSPATNDEVISLCTVNDVFVFPTQFEGTPVSLLETMSVGLVPVITDLEGGIREIVTSDIGFRIPMRDTLGFAKKIKQLYDDPTLLNELSEACRLKAKNVFDVKNTAASYHHLFLKYSQFYRKKERKKEKLGFRLDQPYMPSFIIKLVRSLKRKL